MRPLLCVGVLLAAGSFPGALSGAEAKQRGIPADAIPLISPGAGLTKWRSDQTKGWLATAAVALDDQDSRRLAASSLEGDAVLANTADDPAGKKGSYLYTVDEFGDVEAHVEFLVAEGSNSGVYFMGRYEIQILDSFGVADAELSHGDCGGVYQRWGDRREPKGYDGVAPRTNAARPAGEWQSLDVVFRAPRFGANGRKTEDARFVRVVLNGVLIHENVRCSGPTRAARFSDEASLGPLTLQGDHGPVAFRNLWIRRTVTDR